MEKILGLPVLASKHGADVDKLVIYVHYLMGALFVGWLIYFLLALLKFNQRANPKADYVGIKSHASSWIEGAVVLAEAVLLVGFAVPLWGHAADNFPKRSESTVVKVIAQQFNWNVFYPGPDGEFGKRDFSLVTTDNPWGLDKTDPKGKDDLAPMLGEIHVPVDKPVLIELSSKDVIHSFKIIAMRVTQDAIPGLMIPVQFVPTKTGIYQINCAQLCGNGHASMASGRLIVQTQAEFDAWLKEKANAKPAASFE